MFQIPTHLMIPVEVRRLILTVMLDSSTLQTILYNTFPFSSPGFFSTTMLYFILKTNIDPIGTRFFNPTIFISPFPSDESLTRSPRKCHREGARDSVSSTFQPAVSSRRFVSSRAGFPLEDV